MNKRLVIVGSVIFVLLIILVMALGGGDKKAPSNPGTIVSVDKDTGETIYTDKNKSPEPATSGLVSLYAGDKLYVLMSTDQYNLLRESITFFVKSNIGKDVNIVKVLPDTIKTGEETASFTIKTVNPDKQILVRADLYNGRSIKLVYRNPADNSVIFDTGYLPDDPNLDTGD